MIRFDASIDLTVHTVPVGIPPPVAVARVRSYVEGLPGAGWISVEWYGDAPSSLPWLAIYRPGHAASQTTGPSATLAATRETAVFHALQLDGEARV